MKKLMPRVAAINDISSVGKCSLMIAVPILSSMKIEVVPLVTAVLSAHTGFKNPVIADLGSYLPKMIEHIESLGVTFDCIFSGYLSSASQMETVKEFMLKEKKNGTLCLVDPVLGDEGELYSGFDKNSVDKMKELALVSDILTPNFTEACFLADMEYTTANENTLESLVKLLYDKLHLNKIVITGVPLENDKKCIAVAENREDIKLIYCDYVEGFFCGTGDAFASVVCGETVKGKSLYDASKTAHEFVKYAICDTYKMGGTWEQGIALEKFLDKL